MKEVNKIQNPIGSGLGITGFVLSLVALGILLFLHSFGFLFDIIGLIIGILALILSSIQLKRKRTGLAITGLILSIIVILIGIFNVVSILFLRETVGGFLEGTQRGIGETAENIANTP